LRAGILQNIIANDQTTLTYKTKSICCLDYLNMKSVL